MASYSHIVAIVLIALAVAIAIIEYVLSLKWNARYFTIGIPIFISRIDRPSGLAGVSLETLQKGSATAAGAPLLFHELSPSAIAFREKPFSGSIHYAPIMRGLIRHTPGEPAVAVIGLVKWWLLAALIALAVLLGRSIVLILPWVGGAIAILYLIQGVRFWRVARALRGQP